MAKPPIAGGDLRRVIGIDDKRVAGYNEPAKRLAGKGVLLRFPARYLLTTRTSVMTLRIDGDPPDR